MNERNDLPRPFSDTEYCLLVLQALKRSVRRSETLLQWIPPRNFAHPEADRRQVSEVLDLAIDLVRQHVADQSRGPRL